MKFKHLFLTVSVMALFTSCSNDELVSETTNHGDAIAFSVTTNNATRAADYWCNNNKPAFFEVSAWYGTKTVDGGTTQKVTYFDGEFYELKEGKYTQKDGNYRYWPDLSADKPLNVYAYKVYGETKTVGETTTYTINETPFADFNWNDGNPMIEITPKQEAAKQHDLLYAYTQVKTKPAYGATADINFRHALSQIVFYGKCSNSKIYVEIEEIALYNAAKSGTFTLPTGDNVTDKNFESHNQSGSFVTTGEDQHKGFGTWTLNYDDSKAYRAYTASCPLALTSGASSDTEQGWQNLTDNTTESAFGQSLLVLPTNGETNKLAAYVPEAGKTLAQSGGGACIAIKCKIRNIATTGATVAGNDDIYLWGSASEAKDLVVPVDFNWEQGKKYIYRINFSKKGHGGYNPEDGKEVLVPIQLTVKVDDFAAVADSDATVKDI